MADQQPSLAFSLREEDLEELEQFSAELRNRVNTHHGNGRLYMMQEYTAILADVSAKVRKIRARFDRESISGLRKAHKELKQSARGNEEE